MKGKSLIGVILAAICVTVTYLLPGSEELSHEGITALGVLGMASILWISNTLPFGVTGLLALVMLVLLGVSDMASVFVGFSNSSVIFVITVFCLTAAVMNTKLTLRLINKLLRWAGSSAEKLVLAYMAAAALLSSVMSNVPVTVLFLGLAQPVLKAVGAKPGSSRLGKCLMIGIPRHGHPCGKLLQCAGYGSFRVHCRKAADISSVDGGRTAHGDRSYSCMLDLPCEDIQTRGHKRRMLGINKRRSRKCRQNFGL